MSLVVRTKEINVEAGQVRQVKIQDIAAPIRFELESGTFNYEVLAGTEVIAGPTAVASGVITAPSGAWGSELRITCTGTGKLFVINMG